MKRSNPVSSGFNTSSTVNLQDGIFYKVLDGSYCWWVSAINRQERSGGRIEEYGGGRDGLGHGLSVNRQGSVPSQTNTLWQTESLRL